MSAKLIFLTGVLGTGGYVYSTATSHDPGLFAYSKDQAQTILSKAETTLPRRDGDGQIRIWSTGSSARGVKLGMRYSSDASLLTCEALVEPVDAGHVRVVPDCANSGPSDSAIARTTHALHAPMFEEHILATLGRRPFDRTKAQAKENAIVLGGVQDMRREAMKTADEMQGRYAGVER